MVRCCKTGTRNISMDPFAFNECTVQAITSLLMTCSTKLEGRRTRPKNLKKFKPKKNEHSRWPLFNVTILFWTRMHKTTFSIDRVSLYRCKDEVNQVELTGKDSLVTRAMSSEIPPTNALGKLNTSLTRLLVTVGVATGHIPRGGVDLHRRTIRPIHHATVPAT